MNITLSVSKVRSRDLYYQLLSIMNCMLRMYLFYVFLFQLLLCVCEYIKEDITRMGANGAQRSTSRVFCHFPPHFLGTVSLTESGSECFG